MSANSIPVNKLSPEALRGVIEEFISRDTSAYDEIASSWEARVSEVRQKLDTGLAILIFDDETQTTNIFWADDPIVKNL